MRLKGNLGALALVGTGDVDVPDGETLTVARAAGPFRKTGRGTLVFTGSEDAAMRTLTVAEGTVRLDGFPAVDGYRLGANEVANAPTDWDVYGFRADPSGWFLLDSRRGERIVRANPEWTTFNRTMSTNYLFTAAGRPRAPLVPTTAVELAGPTDFARMRVSSQDPMRVGAVSGTGGISIEDGSAFAPADLTDWTGTFSFPRCGRLGSPARILLSSERGGPAAQPVRVTATNAHVSIENAGTQPVSVLVDDAAPQPLRGRLADGKGLLGDASPVALSAGATLVLDSDYERFGTLSGAGTLRLCNGAVGEVNLCRNGVFTGTVTGKGTLAVCGVATQTLDGATLDVARLELNGGTVAGTASRSGDVALAFNGGVWMGSLSVAGAFTAAGTPVFALPETVPDGFRQTLFAYGSLSEETAACLAAAEVRGEVPEGLKVKVRVDAKRCVLSVAADGTVLFFR